MPMVCGTPMCPEERNPRVPSLSAKHGVAISALAIAAAYVIGDPGTGSAAEGEPSGPAFENLGLFVPEPEVDDGLNRLIIEVPRDAFAEGDADPSLAPEGSIEGLRLSLLLDEDDSAELHTDENGDVWAIYPDGRRILVSGDETAETTAPPDSREALLAALDADDQVLDVRPVDDDTLAVTTTRTETELSSRLALGVFEDERIHAFEDPSFAQQWGLENTGQASGYVADADIDVLGAWPLSARGQGIVVAVMDSGVDFGHPDLAESRWVNTAEECGNGRDDDGNGYVDDCYGWDFVNQDASPWDGNNHFHGTHVAGIIAARDNGVGVVGVAPEATIMDLRVLDTRGSGYTSYFAAAIRYAVDNGARVINMSLGSQPGTSRSGFGSVEQAVEYARSRGVLIVVAAGNDNVNIDSSPVWPANFAPLYDNVLTVASTDYADRRSSFSNYGPNTVTLGAPGSDIL
jgi:subtilisin family serine protease